MRIVTKKTIKKTTTASNETDIFFKRLYFYLASLSKNCFHIFKERKLKPHKKERTLKSDKTRRGNEKFKERNPECRRIIITLLVYDKIKINTTTIIKRIKQLL